MYDISFIMPSFEKSYFNECIGTLLLATILKRDGFSVDVFRFWQIG